MLLYIFSIFRLDKLYRSPGECRSQHITKRNLAADLSNTTHYRRKPHMHTSQTTKRHRKWSIKRGYTYKWKTLCQFGSWAHGSFTTRRSREREKSGWDNTLHLVYWYIYIYIYQYLSRTKGITRTDTWNAYHSEVYYRGCIWSVISSTEIRIV